MSRSLGSSSSWMANLPLVLLGLRSTVREDAHCCPADVVYGSQLRLPGDLVDPASCSPPPDVAPFVANLRASMSSLRPLLPVKRSSRDRDHVPSALSRTSHVFLRVDAVRKPLVPPYEGPFPVLLRGQKTFKILRNNKEVVVSVDRLKPAFIDPLPDTVPRVLLDPPVPPVPVPVPVPSPPRTRAGRRVVPPTRYLP